MKENLFAPRSIRTVSGKYVNVFEPTAEMICIEDIAHELIQPRAELWKLIQATPNLDWLLLTKRPENYAKLFPQEWLRMGFFPRNIWLGATVCNQAEYNTNWQILKYFQYAYNVKVSFISFEPSGFLKDARPMQLEWVQHLIRYTRAFNDSSKHIFFKQFGSQLAKQLKLRDGKGEKWQGQLSPMYDWLTVREIPFYTEDKPIVNAQPTMF